MEFKKPSEGEIQEKLSEIQYRVAIENGTERPFTGETWDNFEKGIYVDVVTGEPLFVSDDKFNSGCGWPSFSRPIDNNLIVMKKDTSHGMTRTEVRSKTGDIHLGHVFPDGPKELGGERYCINSASLRFIAYEDMEDEGYAEYMELVE